MYGDLMILLLVQNFDFCEKKSHHTPFFPFASFCCLHLFCCLHIFSFFKKHAIDPIFFSYRPSYYCPVIPTWLFPSVYTCPIILAWLFLPNHSRLIISAWLFLPDYSCLIILAWLFLPDYSCPIIPAKLFLPSYSCPVIPAWLFPLGYSCLVIPAWLFPPGYFVILRFPKWISPLFSLVLSLFPAKFIKSSDGYLQCEWNSDIF